MAARTEDEIRDFLAKDMSLVEDGLVLINKEEYLPNNQGASGFVDIFAKDKDGKLVIIEIKRSDAAARQAVQELSKYAALLKENRLVKETEYRLLVLSTDWHELLTPFSEFGYATKYDCEGRNIVLDANGWPSAIEKMRLRAPSRTRKFSSRHFIYEFESEEKARNAVGPTAQYMKDVGLNDFVLAVLTVRDSKYGITHLLYFAQQELTFDEYMALIRRRFDGEELEEFEAYIADLSEPEDRISEAADKVWEPPGDDDRLYDLIKPSGAQISHPEKARHWLSPENVSAVEITRFGQFEDEFLSDELIISELTASRSGSDYRLDVSANTQSKPEIDALLEASDSVFFFNPVWRSAIRDLVGYALGTGAVSVRVKAFNNDDALATLAALAIGYTGYLPGFELVLARSDHEETYFGSIGWDGQNPDYKVVIKEYFDGDDFGYFMYRHFGAHRGMNADLMEELGLAYEVYSLSEKNEPVRIRVQGNSISEIKRSRMKTLPQFLEANDEFLGQLVNLFMQSDSQFNQLIASQIEHQFEAAEERLEDKIDPNSDKSIRWLGDADKCDICGRPFAQARFLVDAHMKSGGGATICALCFEAHGTGIGWGKGQLYQREGNKWPLVAGGPPADSL
jgi:hypothetical protein